MKTALVTGASRGLGAEITKQLRELGWLVFSTSVDPILDQVIQMDVTDRLSIQRVKILAGLDGIDLLVNNAGIYTDKEPILGVNEENLLRCIEVNAIGPIKVTQELWPDLIKNKGTVLNISSIRSFIEQATGVNYFLSKNMLNNVSALFKAQGEKDGVRVEVVHPESFKSDMGVNSTRPVEEAAQEILAKIL